MKIETTPMDDLWIGMVTVALVYMVMKTVSTLEKMTKKADAFVNHIGAEVDSASNKLAMEARWIVQRLEKSAHDYRDNLLTDVQSVEIQCYMSKSGIAFGLGPRTVKKKKRSHAAAAAASLPDTRRGSELEKHGHHSSTLALQRCIDRILKNKYRWKWPLSLGFNRQHEQQHRHHFPAVESTSTITTRALAVH